MSAHSAGAYTATVLVMVNVNREGMGVHPHPHQPGLILPSSLNVCQKAAVATLCTLWFLCIVSPPKALTVKKLNRFGLFRFCELPPQAVRVN